MVSEGERSEPLVRGYCPTSFRPMYARDGWLMRIRPPFEGLDLRQAHFITSIAKSYCHNVFQLTSRGNIQLRVADKNNIEIILKKLIVEDLIYPDEKVDARLNILLSPQAAFDDNWHKDTIACAQCLRKGLIARKDLENLSPKFCFGVDGNKGAFNRLEADVIIRYDHQDNGWFIQCGNYRTTSYRTWKKAVDEALKLARAYSRCHWKRRPLRQPDETNALFENAGIQAHYQPYVYGAQQAYLNQPLGLLGSDSAGFHCPLGYVDGQAFEEILSCLEPQRGKIFVTPWRGFICRHISRLPKSLPFVTSHDDPLLRIFACPGKGACEQALGETYPLVDSLKTLLPKQKTLHISGCSKGCAWPHRADYTIVARGENYGFIKDGKAWDRLSSFFDNIQDCRKLFRQAGE